MLTSHVCWGEILWDLFPDGPQLGGAVANVAYHLAALGAPVQLVSRVGDDDLGRRAIEEFGELGADTSLIQVDSTRETGVVKVNLSNNGEPKYSLTPGRAWEVIECTGEAVTAVAAARSFCFGTLSQRLAPGRASFERIVNALPAGCTRFCDPNLRPHHIDESLLELSMRSADVVKLNDVEAEHLARAFGVDDVVAWLFDAMDVRMVAITRGPHGSRLISRDVEHDHPGFDSGDGGDNVGAGDAYLAALVFHVSAGSSVERANTVANRYGAFVASQRGATPALPVGLRDQLIAS